MGTWLRAPGAERALLGATWHRPRSILNADLPRCGAETRVGAKAVLRGVGSDNWGPEGPYGRCSRAAAERCGARRLRSGLRATLSCCAAGRHRPRGTREGQGPEEQRRWWRLIFPQGNVAGRCGHQAALSPGLSAPAGCVLWQSHRPAFSSGTRRPQRPGLHQRQP